MKASSIAGFLALLAAASCFIVPVAAQNVLGRLESDIRQANGQPAATAAVASKVYLGAIALDEAGGGVRITGIRDGGPSQQAGLQAQDLVVGAAGKPIQHLSELTEMLSALNPGDRIPLEVVRGTRRMRIGVVLGTPPAAGPSNEKPSALQPPTGLHAGRTDAIPPPPSGLGGGRTELLPPPPGESIFPSPADGPALNVPARPVAPTSPQSQIEELRHRVEQLERRVQELERSLAEARKK